MIHVGIIGGAGYVAGELLRLLINHDDVVIDYVQSNSHAGDLISHVHESLIGDTVLTFTGSADLNVDVLFLCLGHGNSRNFIERNNIGPETVVIDLSQDFRTNSKWVYGLSELNRDAISAANRIANCGCFATAIQLAFLPLAISGQLSNDLHIQAVTGSTGAGQSPSTTSHFSWRANNLSAYKVFEHQHLTEIRHQLAQVQPDYNGELNFIPIRGCFARGIYVTMYTDTRLSEQDLLELYKDYYVNSPFIHLSHDIPNVKQVANTNKCVLYVSKKGNKAIIISTIDNLLKGAAGQAVQNMNIRFGIPERSGLELKAVAF